VGRVARPVPERCSVSSDGFDTLIFGISGYKGRYDADKYIKGAHTPYLEVHVTMDQIEIAMEQKTSQKREINLPAFTALRRRLPEPEDCKDPFHKH